MTKCYMKMFRSGCWDLYTIERGVVHNKIFASCNDIRIFVDGHIMQFADLLSIDGIQRRFVNNWFIVPHMTQRQILKLYIELLDR